jgi:GT2 family glycosyltransferase
LHRTPAPPSLRTAPVLAILVCHNGENWLPLALSALRRSTIRPRHVLAVDTGSSDRTPLLLAEAVDPEGVVAGPDSYPVLDGVVTLSNETGFAAAVNEAAAQAVERWGDPGAWIWLLHDDCAPEPDCLAVLLRAAEASPSAKVLGPLALDWTDPRLIVESGLSTDASGHRQQIAALDAQSTEVLAVPSAGALIHRELWETLGGFDAGFPLLREDIDFGWRANTAGSLVLSVPPARLRHARAVTTGQRKADALTTSVAAANRAHGLRAFLVNCSPFSFWLGLIRLPVLSTLRALAFLLLRRPAEAGAEFAAIGYLLGGKADLRVARTRRRGTGSGSVRGLFTGRLTRLRNAARAGVVDLVRRRVASEAALGTLPESSAPESAWIPPEALNAENSSKAVRPIGPEALPAGAMRGAGSRGSGLRRPSGVVAVALPDRAPKDASSDKVPSPSRKPSPVRRSADGTPPEPELVFVEVNRRRVLSATLFAPPVVLLIVLTALGLVINGGRLGLDLAGGKLLPFGGLGELWSTYLASWHPIFGGTASPAPAALPVFGILGAVFAPIGGPAALAAVLLIGDLPLAALTAYAATRGLRVHRWVRAGVAAAYAVLPAATASVAQGRLDVVIVHILLPAVIAGIAGLLVRADTGWLHGSVLCALGVALLGAFSPLAHALALLGLVVGFVVLPAPTGLARRVAGVGIVVVLPLALLLPWPSALLNHPELLVQGLGGAAPLTSVTELVGLDPGEAGAWPVGIAIVAAALCVFVLRPSARAAGGLAVVALGVGGLVLVRQVAVTPLQGGVPSPGYAGVPLLVIGAGLLWVILASAQRRPSVSVSWLPKAAALCGVVVLLALGVGAVAAGGQGPLHAGGDATLPSALADELASSGRSVLIVGDGSEPVTQTGGRVPHFGDDLLAPTPGSPERLANWRRDLVTGTPDAVKQAFAAATAAGVLFVVLPPGANPDAFVALAPELAGGAPPMSDGSPVLRMLAPGGQAALISPELAKQAVTGQGAPGAAPGVVPVPASTPDVRVRVSDGPTGRLLVLAAEQEPGWQATVNGQAVPIVPAWGHQVAVSVPERQSDVVVDHPSSLRNLLLLGQIAAVLFTLLTAVPSRRARS